MKLLKPSIAIICLLFLFFLISCEKRIKTTNNAVTFDSIHVSETYYLFNDTGQPSCNLQIDFVFPQKYEDKQVLSQMQGLFQEKTLGESFIDLSLNDAIKQYKEQYFNDFKQFEKNTEASESEDEHDDFADETGRSYYAKIKNAIVFNQNNLISFTVDFRDYQGGAHGSHSLYGYVLDLKTGNLIREDQFLGGNYKKDMADLIARKIAEKAGVSSPKELEMLGYNNIEGIVPNGNFTIDEKGITYYYNENEIAAYVMGLIEVFILYEEINIYIKKDNPIATLAGL